MCKTHTFYFALLLDSLKSFILLSKIPRVFRDSYNDAFLDYHEAKFHNNNRNKNFILHLQGLKQPLGNLHRF